MTKRPRFHGLKTTLAAAVLALGTLCGGCTVQNTIVVPGDNPERAGVFPSTRYELKISPPSELSYRPFLEMASFYSDSFRQSSFITGIGTVLEMTVAASDDAHERWGVFVGTEAVLNNGAIHQVPDNLFNFAFPVTGGMEDSIGVRYYNRRIDLSPLLLERLVFDAHCAANGVDYWGCGTGVSFYWRSPIE